MLSATNTFNQKVEWFAKPSSDHIAQFYHSDEELLDKLEVYVESGLKNSETCIVIATGSHLEKLNERLRGSVELSTARQAGIYIDIKASEILADCTADGNPSLERLRSSIVALLERSAEAGAPVRIFGEIVALLWKNGDHSSVGQLESLWNDLSNQFSFSLYCAYPRLHFDPAIHNDILSEIDTHHTFVTPSFARG